MVAVPSNQFRLQEPGSDQEIKMANRYVRPGNNFEPTYRIASKNEVNGENADPLFKWLRGSCPITVDTIGNPTSFYWSPVGKNDITWNFVKFLIDKNGKPYKRYHPTVFPEEMEDDIRELLARD